MSGKAKREKRGLDEVGATSLSPCASPAKRQRCRSSVDQVVEESESNWAALRAVTAQEALHKDQLDVVALGNDDDAVHTLCKSPKVSKSKGAMVDDDDGARVVVESDSKKKAKANGNNDKNDENQNQHDNNNVAADDDEDAVAAVVALKSGGGGGNASAATQEKLEQQQLYKRLSESVHTLVARLLASKSSGEEIKSLRDMHLLYDGLASREALALQSVFRRLGVLQLLVNYMKAPSATGGGSVSEACSPTAATATNDVCPTTVAAKAEVPYAAAGVLKRCVSGNNENADIVGQVGAIEVMVDLLAAKSIPLTLYRCGVESMAIFLAKHSGNATRAIKAGAVQVLLARANCLMRHNVKSSLPDQPCHKSNPLLTTSNVLWMCVSSGLAGLTDEKTTLLFRYLIGADQDLGANAQQCNSVVRPCNVLVQMMRKHELPCVQTATAGIVGHLSAKWPVLATKLGALGVFEPLLAILGSDSARLEPARWAMFAIGSLLHPDAPDNVDMFVRGVLVDDDEAGAQEPSSSSSTSSAATTKTSVSGLETALRHLQSSVASKNAPMHRLSSAALRNCVKSVHAASTESRRAVLSIIRSPLLGIEAKFLSCKCAIALSSAALLVADVLRYFGGATTPTDDDDDDDDKNDSGEKRAVDDDDENDETTKHYCVAELVERLDIAAKLIDLLGESNAPAVRAFGVQALLNFAGSVPSGATILVRHAPALIEPLVKMLDMPCEQTQVTVCGLLCRMASARYESSEAICHHNGIERLAKLLTSPCIEVQRRAAGTIGSCASNSGHAKRRVRLANAVPALVDLLKSSRPEVHAAAACALANAMRDSPDTQLLVHDLGGFHTLVDRFLSEDAATKRWVALALFYATKDNIKFATTVARLGGLRVALEYALSAASVVALDQKAFCGDSSGETGCE
jgi:Holliday junction resolvase